MSNTFDHTKQINL